MYPTEHFILDASLCWLAFLPTYMQLDKYLGGLVLGILSLSLAANFSFAEHVLRWLLSRSGRADSFRVLYNAAISLVQARREENKNKSTKVTW